MPSKVYIVEHATSSRIGAAYKPAKPLLCESCSWCLAIPAKTRWEEYHANLEDGEQPTEAGLTAWLVDAYPTCTRSS